VLLEAFCARAGEDRLVTSRHCLGVAQDESGLTLTFSDGPTGSGRFAVRGKLAIACDGIN
jgi:hypothetical protein